MAARFFSITTEFMRAQLRQAFVVAQANKRTLLAELTMRQGLAMDSVASGSPLKMMSANGHMAQVQDAGVGSAAPQEFVEMFENLISRLGSPVGIGVEPATRYLNFCFLHGLDPNCPDNWPCPIPAPIDPPPPAATEQQIYDFVMCNLVAITESSSDYFWLRIKGGLQLV